MVKLLIGHKGSGKTKKMVELANDCVNNVSGSVVFINKSSRLTTDLKYSIRVICLNDYSAIKNTDQLIGFLYGVVSQDHDIENLYLDSVLHLEDVKLENLEDFFERLDVLAKEHEINCIVSVSADMEQLGDYINKYEIENLVK